MDEAKDKLTISKIWARNFKSLRKFDLDLSSLTVLVGRNGSGKSNIIDVLNFISDAMYDGVQSAINYRNGPHSILHVSPGDVAKEFTVGLRATKESFVADYQLTIRGETRDRVSLPEERITLWIDGKVTSIVVRYGVFREPNLGTPIRSLQRSLQKKPTKKTSTGAGLTPMLSLIGDQPSFAAMMAYWLFPDRPSEETLGIAMAISELSILLGEMRFYRIFPDAIREPQPVSVKDSLEEDGSNFASVLRSLKTANPDSYSRVIQGLRRVASGIVDIEVNRFGENQVVRLVHSSSENPAENWRLDISQESEGTARALALLVAIQQHPAPTLLAIEEPELGIHTGVLSVIEDLLEDTSSESQVLVSTHSSDFLDFVPTDAIRTVASINGETVAGMIADHQREVIRDELMTAGDVHRVEGLELDNRSDPDNSADD